MNTDKGKLWRESSVFICVHLWLILFVSVFSCLSSLSWCSLFRCGFPSGETIGFAKDPFEGEQRDDDEHPERGVPELFAVLDQPLDLFYRKGRGNFVRFDRGEDPP